MRAIVSRDGRPDLALNVLPEVKPPVPLVVGGRGLEVLEMNRQAAQKLTTEHDLVVVPEASHRFEEPGKLDTVADLARAWFAQHMKMPGEVHAAGAGKRNHIDCIDEHTDRAWQIFNQEMERGTKVGGAFHLTC